MTVKHHWALPIVRGRGPDVEEKTILGWFWFIPPRWLDGGCTKFQRIPDARPRLECRRSTEAVCARNLAGIGHAFKAGEPCCSPAAQLAIGCFDFYKIHVDISPACWWLSYSL